ncbi:MAG: hypothetical protein EOP51_31760, partial [Sphingobacteriales bacterium]
LFMYGFAVYIVIVKKELALLYLPVLFFINTLIGEHAITAFVYYGIICFLIIYIIRHNSHFMKANVFAIMLIIYFAVLMGKSANLVKMRSDVFNVMWMFFLIPLVPMVFKKYTRDVIMKELGLSCCIILIIFIVNTGLSTVFHYNTQAMYGITSGILYGNMYATDFNILSIAIFVLLLRAINTKNILYLVVSIIALGFVTLTLRRSVISLSILGVGLVVLLFFIQNIKSAMIFGIVAVLAAGLFFTKSKFLSTFNERYELRQLDERALDEEKRLYEYELIYRDMFIHHRYSMWFGYGLLDSPGHYGDGKLYDRSLHSDVTSIAHSSGVIGLTLYMLMFALAFGRAIKASYLRADNFILFFCAIAFITYTGTGRFTQVGCLFLLTLVLSIPLAAPVYEVEAEEVEEPKAGNDTGQLMLN